MTNKECVAEFHTHAAKPADFVPLKEWFEEFGAPVFASAKMLHYHTHPIQRELIESGAMAKVGSNIFLHKVKFWPEFQRVMLEVAGKVPSCF